MSNQVKKLKILIKTIGGEVTPAASLAPKIGPLGLSPKKIGEDIAKKTKKNWDGIPVTVFLIVHKKKTKIRLCPSTSSLIKRELRKNTKKNLNDHNISIKQLIKITKKVFPRSYSTNFKCALKEVLGTCSTLFLTINGIKSKTFTKKVDRGDLNILF